MLPAKKADESKAVGPPRRCGCDRAVHRSPVYPGVLLGLGTAAAIGIGGALFFALKPQHQTTGSELYNTNNRNTPDGLANFREITPGCPSRCRSSGRRCLAIPGGRWLNAGAPAPGMPAGADPSSAQCTGAGGGTGQPSLRDDQCRSNHNRRCADDTGCLSGACRRQTADQPASRRRITSSPSSMAMSIGAQPVLIAFKHRRANTCCRQARSSLPH